MVVVTKNGIFHGASKSHFIALLTSMYNSFNFERCFSISSKIVAFNALQLSFCSLAPDHFDGGWLESVIHGDRSTCFAFSCYITFTAKIMLLLGIASYHCNTFVITLRHFVNFCSSDLKALFAFWL